MRWPKRGGPCIHSLSLSAALEAAGAELAWTGWLPLPQRNAAGKALSQTPTRAVTIL